MVAVEQGLRIGDQHRVQRRPEFQQITKNNCGGFQVLKVATGKLGSIRGTGSCLSFSSQRRPRNSGQLHAAPIQNLVVVLLSLQDLLRGHHDNEATLRRSIGSTAERSIKGRHNPHLIQVQRWVCQTNVGVVFCELQQTVGLLSCCNQTTADRARVDGGTSLQVRRALYCRPLQSTQQTT